MTEAGRPAGLRGAGLGAGLGAAPWRGGIRRSGGEDEAPRMSVGADGNIIGRSDGCFLFRIFWLFFWFDKNKSGTHGLTSVSLSLSPLISLFLSL